MPLLSLHGHVRPSSTLQFVLASRESGSQTFCLAMLVQVCAIRGETVMLVMLNMLVFISVIPVQTCNIQHFTEQSNNYRCFYATHEVNIEHWNI